MADFELKLDLSEVIEAHKAIAQGIEAKVRIAAQTLAIQAHAHVKEQAQAKLHSRREMFMEALDFDEPDVNTWSIIVRESGRWIEDGQEPHSMLDDLLKSPKAKTAKDGSKYLVIPFKHNKGPTQRTKAQSELLGSLKTALKDKGIPYGKIEKNPDGSPKLGLLHKMDLQGPKQKRPQEGAMGPVGRPHRVDAPGVGEVGPAGRPHLWGVRIYQKAKKNADGSPKVDGAGQAMATREIMTFRVASSKQQGSNKWFHPGTAPMHFLDDAYAWASDQWDSKIEPELLRYFDGA